MDTTTILTFPEWRALRALVCMFLMIFGIHGCVLESDDNITYSTDSGVGGGAFTCSGEYLSRFPEACDGFDDDCDGMIDEGIVSCDVPRADLPFKNCNTVCCFGDSACNPEQVCHPLDGQGRCGEPCQDGELRLCSFGCEPRFQACVGRVWAPCDSEPPQDEVCNQRDDDCDGVVDEGGDCTSPDQGIDAGVTSDAAIDLGVVDAEIVVDAQTPDSTVDPVDSAVPEPECTRHSACPRFQLCLNNQCTSGLPGTFNITIYSARIGDLPGDSPDMFGELKIGMSVAGTTEYIDDDDTPTWNHRVRVGLDVQQILELCIWDHDGFLNGNDLAGCSQFSSETVVETIRAFSGTRMSPNWATFNPPITSGQSLDSVFLHVDRL